MRLRWFLSFFSPPLQLVTVSHLAFSEANKIDREERKRLSITLFMYTTDRQTVFHTRTRTKKTILIFVVRLSPKRERSFGHTTEASKAFHFFFYVFYAFVVSIASAALTRRAPLIRRQAASDHHVVPQRPGNRRQRRPLQRHWRPQDVDREGSDERPRDHQKQSDVGRPRSRGRLQRDGVRGDQLRGRLPQDGRADRHEVYVS